MGHGCFTVTFCDSMVKGSQHSVWISETAPWFLAVPKKSTRVGTEEQLPIDVLD